MTDYYTRADGIRIPVLAHSRFPEDLEMPDELATRLSKGRTKVYEDCGSMADFKETTDKVRETAAQEVWERQQYLDRQVNKTIRAYVCDFPKVSEQEIRLQMFLAVERWLARGASISASDVTR